MNTTLKATALVLILCATILSGCIGGSDIPLTATIPMGAEDAPGSYSIRVILEEDGVAEICTIGISDIVVNGTWEQISDGEYAVSATNGGTARLTLQDNGKATMESSSVVHEGTWTKGVVR